MEHYIDTEFIEKPGSIQLVSIGIASEDGRTFYAENTGFDERDADDWVRENVLEKLRWWGRNVGESDLLFNQIFRTASKTEVFGTIPTIRVELLDFLANDPAPIFYGYFADYDWVVFCWIFGKMIDLPSHFPMYCRDLKQMLDESGKKKIPKPEGEHNALVDALWNRDLHRHLTED